jgi:hypothetical protein
MAISVPIIASFDGRGVSKAIRDFKKLEGAGNKMAFGLLNTNAAVNKGIAQFAKFGAIGAGVVGVIGGKLVQAAYESQKVMKQTEAIVAATGGAAGLTAKQIGDLSEKLSLQTGVDDELIQSSMNLLLTFKQVQDQAGKGNDIFTRASQAALDLGNVFGSTDAAAKMLGKALANPTKGVSALAKAGVNFSDQQKKQIKTLVDSGNILDAQKLILAEVESQVGGTARATATGFDLMTVAIGNVAEDLGDILLPFVEQFATYITNVVVPKLQEFAQIVGDEGIGAGFKYLGEQGLIALGKLNGWGDLVYGVVAAVIALNVATGIYTATQTIATIAMAAFGTAATGTAIAVNAALFGIPALVGLVVVALVALALRFKSFRELITSVGKTLFDVFKTVGNFFFDNVVNPIVRGINILIKAFNSLPLLADIPLLGELQIGTDKAVKGLAKVASAADFRKFEGFNDGKKKKTIKPTPIPTGGGSGKETAMDKAKKALDKYTSALKLFGQETKQYKQSIKDVQSAQMSLANATDDVRVAQEKFNKVSKGYGADSKEAATATTNLAQARRAATRATIGLREATQSVADAQKKLDDLKSGKATSDATQDLAYATQKVEDAKKSLADAYVQGGEKTIADAASRLSDAYAEQKDAVEAVRKAQEESDPNAIIEAEDDLTKAKLDLADAQDEVKNSAQDVIDKQQELNDIVSGAPATSDAYKDALKDLTDAQKAEKDAIDGVTEAYDKQAESLLALTNAKKGLADASKATTGKQEKSAQKITGIDPNTGLPITTSGGGGSDVLMGGLPNIDFSNIDLSGIDWTSIIPFMADGGIVNRPTLAMIGENGAEAVVPLSQMGNMGGGNINVTVNTGVGDPVAIGKSVVDALQAYQRRSGALQIKVA